MEKKEKKLNLFDLVSVGVGSVIGSGIFSMLGTGISMTGRSISLALVFAIVLVFLQSFRQLFMSSMFAFKGGSYAYQALILPKMFAGVSGIVYLISALNFSVLGIAITSYLTQLFPALQPYNRVISILVLLLFFIAATGPSVLSKFQNVMVICMYAALILLIAFGLPHVQKGGFEGEPFFMNGTLGFLTAVATMSFTCTGGVNIMNMTDVSKKPKRNIR